MRSPLRISLRTSPGKVHASRRSFSVYFVVSARCVRPSGCPGVGVHVEAAPTSGAAAQVFEGPTDLAWSEEARFHGMFEVRRAHGLPSPLPLPPQPSARGALDLGLLKVSEGDRGVYGRRMRVRLTDDPDEALRSVDLELAIEVEEARPGQG